MLKKIIVEKLYLFIIIILVGGYSAMSMLTTEHDSVYTNEDPILLKLLVGSLFMAGICYIIINRRYLCMNKIGRTLLFLCSYMALWRVIDMPYNAGLLSYFYQPLCDLLIISTFVFACVLAAKSKELVDFFATGMIVAMLITSYYYYNNWTFANEVEEAHLGTSYYVLFLLTTLLLTPHKWLRYIALIITGVVLFSSFKRGGVIALVLAIVTYLFVKEVLIERRLVRMIVFLIAIAVLFVILIYVDKSMGNIISDRILNIQDDGGSGRDQVWRTTWSMISESDLEELLFGHGFNAVLKHSPMALSAHNDFLEILFNYGIIGFVPYLLLHFQLIKQVIYSIKMRETNASAMAFTYTIFFVLSMISHVIVYPWMCLVAIPWGLTQAEERSITNQQCI